MLNKLKLYEQILGYLYFLHILCKMSYSEILKFNNHIGQSCPIQIESYLVVSAIFKK